MNQMRLQPWETELGQKYRQLIELYEQAAVTAGGLPEMFATGREADDALRQLHGVFGRAAQFEKEVRPSGNCGLLCGTRRVQHSRKS